MSNDINFIYPDKEIIGKSKDMTNQYTNPLIGLYFWDGFKRAFNFLKRQQKRYNTILEIGTSRVLLAVFMPNS